MQIEGEVAAQERSTQPFEIIYHARSSKASRSRKSSIHTIDKEKPKMKTKKLRKMTLNPETFRFQQLQQIEQLRHQHRAPRSEKGEIEEEEVSISEYLELGMPSKIPSKKELELQNGIFVGIATERELDSDFNLSGWQQNVSMDLQLKD